MCSFIIKVFPKATVLDECSKLLNILSGGRKMNRAIKSVRAMEVYTKKSHPGIEAVVITEDGREGRAICTAGNSVGSHEVKFQYDGGSRWNGLGVMNAVRSIEEIIAPAIQGLDVADQYLIDEVMLGLRDADGNKLGGNALAAVSAAVLKAGAASLQIPLYRHIGGANAMYLPVPGIGAVNGHKRWGGGVTTPSGKPSYSFMCHGFKSFAEASYAGWEIQNVWDEMMESIGMGPKDWYGMYTIPKGVFQSDEGIWEKMTQAIQKAGYEGRVGIQVDVASDTYYDPEKKKYFGLFSDEPKTRDDLMDLYLHAIKEYPFIIIEDPFYEDDYESHALLTSKVDIQIVGDDLFTTNVERLKKGADMHAANTMLLKVNQIGTMSQAFETIQYAYKMGYGVMPCESRGEGTAIADYCVGINACAVREMATGEVANRFLEIEQELGTKARFMGTRGLMGERFRQ